MTLRRLASGYAVASFVALATSREARSRMLVGASGRLAYGFATLFAPRFVAGRYAAAEPDSVMNLRGFGGQHVAIAIFTILSARTRRLARSAVLLNVGVEVCDGVAGGFEVRERGTGDEIALGGVVLPLINLTYWLSTLRAVRR